MTQAKRVPLFALATSAIAIAATGCGGSTVARGGEDDEPVKPKPTATARADGSPAPRKEDTTPYAVTVKASGAEVRTKGSGVNECVDVTATVKKGTTVAAGVAVDFKASVKYGEGEVGRVAEETVKTDDKGLAVNPFCGGDAEGAVIVQAKAGASSAVTGEIKVTSIPSFRFSHKDAKEKSHALLAREVKKDAEKFLEVVALPVDDTDKKDPIALSLAGGGSDCSTVEFELTKDGVAVSGEKITFTSQEDFPLGVKLARREGVGATKINPVTGKRYALYEAESNIEGVFSVPVCSGGLAGYIMLQANYTDPTGKSHDVKSPLVSMKGGITNYGHLSVTFDRKNSRVAPSDTFTNSTLNLAFVANLGTRNDGAVIKTYPLGVITEIGKALVKDNGFADDTGKVGFTYEVLNVRGKRPVRKHPSLPDLDANMMACDPLAFTTRTPFATLAENWRSTMTYFVKGSEYHNDPNQNGVFDKGAGDGYWDRNENGQFDVGIDELTLDWKGDGLFDPSGEWFIDLPSPFVDANENMTYDPGETLVGDSYVKPNGEWDSGTFLWKSAKLPVYLGVTEYSLNHSAISSTINDFTPSDGYRAYHEFLHTSFAGTPYNSMIANNDTARRNQLFSVGPSVTGAKVTTPEYYQGEQNFYMYVHLQDKCGSPMPGGSKLSLSYRLRGKPAFGERVAGGVFYEQPMDAIRERSKRLLLREPGEETGSSAIVNFDTLEHPAAKASFPIEFRVFAGRCTNFCSGDLHVSVASNPPAYCDGQDGEIVLNVNDEMTLSHDLSMPLYWEASRMGVVTAANKCGCVAGATNKGGVCSCPTGTQVNVTGDQCVPTN